MTRDEADVEGLVAAARASPPGGSAPLARQRAIARLLTLVEDESPLLPQLMAALAPHTGRAHVVGITGAPGVGKSTSTSSLVTALRAEGRTVGVLAIDPSSPFTGGALLGDRVRMSDHATDPGVFIRSMASRGHLGGLAWTTPQALRVLDAVGFDVVLVETVGVGQSEVEIAGAADSTVVVLAPGMGDGIQAAKAGILEIGDVYAVNKSDLPGADVVRRDLASMLKLTERAAGSWKPPVLALSAASGEGTVTLVESLAQHRVWARHSGALVRRRETRARAEIEALAMTALRSRWGGVADGDRLNTLAASVAAGQLDPHAAAAQLLESAFGSERRGQA